MLTLTQIHEGIIKELTRIGELVNEIAVAGDESAHAEAIYKSKFAQARLASRALGRDKVTVGQVDDEATDMTSAEHLAYLIASNKLMTCREALRASQARLDGLRTLSTSFRQAGG